MAFSPVNLCGLPSFSCRRAGGNRGLGLAQGADRPWERSLAETEKWKTDTSQKVNRMTWSGTFEEVKKCDVKAGLGCEAF